MIIPETADVNGLAARRRVDGGPAAGAWPAPDEVAGHLAAAVVSRRGEGRPRLIAVGASKRRPADGSMVLPASAAGHPGRWRPFRTTRPGRGGAGRERLNGAVVGTDRTSRSW